MTCVVDAGHYVCLSVCADNREQLVLYFLVGLLIGGISVLLLVNVYLMAILVRHRRQLRGLGVQPVSSRLRRRRRGPETRPTSHAEAASFVNGRRTHRPPSASPEVSRRGVQWPRPPRRPPSPLEVVQPTTPTSPPGGQVHLPPRDSPVFVHVESPRESPLLGRVPPVRGTAEVDGLLPATVDVSLPPSDSTVGEESPIWVRLEEAPTSDGTATVPEPPTLLESPVWVHLAFDDSPSTTVSTTTAAVVPSSSASPASTFGARVAPRRAAAVVYPGEVQRPPPSDSGSLTRSYSNPYRQDTYHTAERRARTSQRPRQRRLLHFD